MTRRKPSLILTQIVSSIDEDKLRRTRNRMLVATKIADTLCARGISQKRFAEMMDRSESEISEWLSGDRNFTIDTLSDIKESLGIDLLNVSSMRISPISNEESRIKMAKTRTPVVYERHDMVTFNVSSVWLSASQVEASIAA